MVEKNHDQESIIRAGIEKAMVEMAAEFGKGVGENPGVSETEAMKTVRESYSDQMSNERVAELINQYNDLMDQSKVPTRSREWSRPQAAISILTATILFHCGYEADAYDSLCDLRDQLSGTRDVEGLKKLDAAMDKMADYLSGSSG